MTAHLRIAIADDASEVREHFAKVLSDQGHSIIATAANGRELVEKCRQNRPDLLITEICMDELTGIEAMKELAKDGALPTILVAGSCFRENVDDDSQILALLTKPVKLPALTAAVAVAARQLQQQQ